MTDGLLTGPDREEALSRAYVQAVDPNEVFRIGDRVRIMTVNGTSRVTR